jgi:hypothetical protein
MFLYAERAEAERKLRDEERCKIAESERRLNSVLG